jgi:hypothetical protein
LRAEYPELKRANEILKAASALFARELDRPPDEVTAVIEFHGECFGAEPICRVLEASPSTYYARRARTPCARQVRDEQLLVEIRRVHAANYGVYGARVGLCSVHAPSLTEHGRNRAPDAYQQVKRLGRQ